MTDSWKSYVGLGLGGVVVAVVVVVVGVRLSNNFLTNGKLSLASAATPVCQNIRVTIKNDEVTPRHISAHVCDKLTILNADAKERVVAFGQHEHHVAYDGVTEKFLEHGQMVTVNLNQTGDFLFHDHDQEEVQGTFTVAQE
jgi:hypothetical protein